MNEQTDVVKTKIAFESETNLNGVYCVPKISFIHRIHITLNKDNNTENKVHTPQSLCLILLINPYFLIYDEIK